MREYEDEKPDLTGRDVCCAWLVVAAVLSVVLLLPLMLQAVPF
jgi:hypothetical protein